MDNPIRVLQISQGTGMFGGVSTFLLNYYREIDHSKVRFDFLFCHEESFGKEAQNPVFHDSEINCLGCLDSSHNRINNYRELSRELSSFLKGKSYDYIHINSGSIPLQTACIYAIREVNSSQCIISHSHSVGQKEKTTIRNITKHMLFGLSRGYIRNNVSYCFACSTEAAIALFGRKIENSKKLRIIHNAITCDKYKYTDEKRRVAREELGITDNCFVIGHVGRFDKVKNHKFLIDVFSEIYKIIPNSLLVIVGEGSERKTIENHISEMDLEEVIYLTGERSDVNVLLQAFDCFVLPSFYEGLSLVSVEAQASGLQTYLSSGLSKEHSVTDLVSYIPLDAGAKFWAERICSKRESVLRYDSYRDVIEAGYDIRREAKKLEDFYIQQR